MPRRSPALVQHSRDGDGLNVAPSQQLGLSRGYSTIFQVFPSTSAPAFNSFFIIDVKPQNAFLESVNLNFNTTALSGLAGGTPYMLPCPFWIQRIELVINDKVIDTILGEIIWKQHQLFSDDDETRKGENAQMGDYSNTTTLNTL